MLVPAKMCNTLQYAEKQTQNPFYITLENSAPNRTEAHKVGKLNILIKLLRDSWPHRGAQICTEVHWSGD